MIVSLCLRSGDSVFGAVRVGGERPKPDRVVLYYHGVTREERTRFGRQMDDLRRLAEPVSTDRNQRSGTGLYQVAVTFDDGFRSTLENGLPEALGRKIPVTLFIPTGYLGKKVGWIEGDSHEDRCEAVATEEEIKGLPKDLVSIGSHTVSHANLRKLDVKAMKREVIESKERLEDVLGRRITMISLPYGEYDERVLKVICEAGYERIFSSLPRLTRKKTYLTERVPVRPSDWPLEFRLKVLGGYRWLPYTLGLKRKLRGE